ncbi:MAG: thioredoxin [Thermoleophilia bacterium]|jgi:thioredoxin 1|nr:thioredoxin [Thermoleophilia bacterium]MBJ7333797.1 thioredoxin [Thermoleophilia bacterium]
MSDALEINSANFQGEVIESDIPVLIDFWAEWCGPCKALSPIIDELAGEYAGKVKIAKLDVDAEPGLAGKYGVLSIPMVALFKDGEVVERSVGLKPKDRLVADLNLSTHSA